MKIPQISHINGKLQEVSFVVDTEMMEKMKSKANKVFFSITNENGFCVPFAECLGRLSVKVNKGESLMPPHAKPYLEDYLGIDITKFCSLGLNALSITYIETCRVNNNIN